MKNVVSTVLYHIQQDTVSLIAGLSQTVFNHFQWFPLFMALRTTLSPLSSLANSHSPPPLCLNYVCYQSSEMARKRFVSFGVCTLYSTSPPVLGTSKSIQCDGCDCTFISLSSKQFTSRFGIECTLIQLRAIFASFESSN